MTKSQMLELIRLLSALEAAGVINQKLPDYLLSSIQSSIQLLSSEVLK